VVNCSEPFSNNFAIISSPYAPFGGTCLCSTTNEVISTINNNNYISINSGDQQLVEASTYCDCSSSYCSDKRQVSECCRVKFKS